MLWTFVKLMRTPVSGQQRTASALDPALVAPPILISAADGFFVNLMGLALKLTNEL